jgi:hypothetical protein
MLISWGIDSRDAAPAILQITEVQWTVLRFLYKSTHRLTMQHLSGVRGQKQNAEL